MLTDWNHTTIQQNRPTHWNDSKKCFGIFTEPHDPKMNEPERSPRKQNA